MNDKEYIEACWNEIEKNKQEDSMATSCGKFKKEDLDVTKDISENNFENIWTKYKAYDKKIFFFQNNLSSYI